MSFRLGIMFVAVCMLVPSISEAASLYISPNTSTLYRGDSQRYTVRLNVDTDQCVNAVDAVITYPAHIQPVDVSVGGSIFSVWIEQPTINRDQHTITFAGGIPNGYCGRIDGDPRLTNGLVDIIFSSPGFVVGAAGTASTTATLNFTEDTVAYLNDGFGTQIALATFPATIELIDSVGSSVQNDWVEFVNNDTQPPSPFSISLERTPNAFSNDYFITFSTTDKQSGVSYYEVMEEPLGEASFFRWGSETAPWLKTRSPYVLQDQSLQNTIYVRAVDKAGNEYMAVLVPDESLRSVSSNQLIKYLALAAGSVLVVILVMGAVVVVRRRQTKSTNDLPL